jgi:hypothetical protein
VTLEELKNIMQFLQRAQLQGSEVPAWVAAYNALNAEIAKLQTTVQ